jgi:hypothetical protein
MRPTYFAPLALLIGCVESAPDSTPALVVEPANIRVTVVDGKPVAQPFTATLIDGDGDHDVTAETTFVLADTAAGDWSGSTLQIDGEVLGPTEVIAAHGDLQARTGLTVYARNLRMNDVPANAPTLFDSAAIDPSCEPAISYPADGAVVPQNLGVLDVQWSDTRDDWFEVSFATTYVETRIYTRRTSKYAAAWTQLAGADWNQLAGQREPIALRMSGIADEAPALRCTSATRHVYVSDQPATGKLYTSNSDGIYRFDTANPSVAPEQLLSSATWEAMIAPVVGSTTTDCIGCSLSRDGSRFAIASETTGAIYDFEQNQITAAPHSWSFATFNLSGSKLITSNAGNLEVIGEDGALLSTVESKPGYEAYDPQLSPDGLWLANIEATSSSLTFAATIVVRRFFDASNEMSASLEVVPFAPDTANYYPSWSPDGEWLVFTRATGWGTADTSASIWIVRADGTQPAIQLTAPATGLDVRAQFVPSMMSVDGERMFYITFESREAFGEQLAAGSMQVWAMPFYPNRTVGAASATAPAIRLPMQSLETDNRMLQWIR